MPSTDEQKAKHLRKHGAFNTGAKAVIDPLFGDSEFFDPCDLVLVKYEMLRRAQVEGMPAALAARRFGFSRSGFYKTLSAFNHWGLVGLIPARPGPRHAHKLTDDIMKFIDAQAAEQGLLPASELAALLLDKRDVRVHPRSIERALARREKRGA
jgi:transposase